VLVDIVIKIVVNRNLIVRSDWATLVTNIGMEWVHLGPPSDSNFCSLHLGFPKEDCSCGLLGLRYMGLIVEEGALADVIVRMQVDGATEEPNTAPIHYQQQRLNKTLLQRKIFALGLGHCSTLVY